MNITHIVRQLEEIQNGKIWIGTSFHLKLRNVNKTIAFTQPVDGLHSVAEIIGHLITWRQEAILKIRTGSGSITDAHPRNWRTNETLKEIGWEHLQKQYDDSLIELIELIRPQTDDFLDKMYYDTDFKKDYSYRFLIEGMLHHDLYHLGQLGIVLKFIQISDTN